MKIGRITSTDRRYDLRKDTNYGIFSYGDRNNYPQLVKRLVNNSVTGSSCLKIYKSFIKGQGFVNTEKVNNQDLNKLLSLISDDLATYGGFAISVGYNLNLEVASLEHIPFEFVRLAYNREGVKIHPDWAKENTNIKQFDARDIVNLPFYNPDKEVLEEQIKLAGGLENYKGQCYYFSNKGERCYPLPIFDSALVDMSTEEAISDITHRNAKNGFYPAGMLVDVSTDADTDSGEVENVIDKMQGSVNAAKILYSKVANKEEIPQFVSFESNNYDKAFTVSRNAAKENIIRAFNLPLVLAGENVGNSFGSSLINESYKFYNSITIIERAEITKVFEELYPDFDWRIKELVYLEEDKTANILEIVLNNSIDADTKKKILVSLYKVSEEEVNNLLGIKEE